MLLRELLLTTDNYCIGPISSFLVISDPAAAKHVLQATDNPKNPIYGKGLVAEVRFLGLTSLLISIS